MKNLIFSLASKFSATAIFLVAATVTVNKSIGKNIFVRFSLKDKNDDSISSSLNGKDAKDLTPCIQCLKENLEEMKSVLGIQLNNKDNLHIETSLRSATEYLLSVSDTNQPSLPSTNCMQWNSDTFDYWTFPFSQFFSVKSCNPKVLLSNLLLSFAKISSLPHFTLEYQSLQRLVNCLSMYWHHFTDDVTELQIVVKIAANVAVTQEGKMALHLTDLPNHLCRLSTHDDSQLCIESWRAVQNLMNVCNEYYLSGIYPIVPPWMDQNPECDVVLVHGIKGGAAWTWRQNDNHKLKPNITDKDRKNIFVNKAKCEVLDSKYTNLWPLDWLASGLSVPVRVIAVDYPSKWSIWGDGQEQEKECLDDLSNELRAKLRTAGVGDRPIIWISHSMGGLLVKSMLLHDDNEIMTRDVKEKKDSCNKTPSNHLLEKTLGVVFLSVPHLGSPLVSWAVCFSSVCRPTPYLCHIKADSSELNVLNSAFVNVCESFGIQVLTINENRKFKPYPGGPAFTFVPHKYGDPNYGEYCRADVCHLNICKPNNRSSYVFVTLENFIKKLLENCS